ncbi:MAG: hypothetical protein ACFE8L_08665 [Candidatus Hodarchaeota archaeon]
MKKLTKEDLEYISSYTEQRLQSLANEQIWKGTGTELDPFIVKNANILGQAILLNKTCLYISFINCNFDRVQFEGCQNILLKNCTFKKLVLNKCKKFQIDDSFINELSFSKTKHISFKNSIVLNVSKKYRIKSIVFKDCQINNSFLDFILKKSNSGLYSNTKETVTSIIIIFVSLILFRLFILESTELGNLILYIVVTLLLLIFLLFSFFHEFKLRKKRPKIKILDNR